MELDLLLIALVCNDKHKIVISFQNTHLNNIKNKQFMDDIDLCQFVTVFFDNFENISLPVSLISRMNKLLLCKHRILNFNKVPINKLTNQINYID